MQNLFRRLTNVISNKKRPSPYPLRSISGRVLLHPLQSAELPIINGWFEDHQTCELAFGVKAPVDILESMRDEYLAELGQDRLGVLTVRIQQPSDLEAPQLVGFVRYKLFNRGRNRSARVGIILGPPALRGQRIGREAFETLISYLFESRDVQTIDLDTASFNTQAQHCFRSCGFDTIGETEFGGISSGWTEKRIMMRLTRNQWRALAEADPPPSTLPPQP